MKQILTTVTGAEDAAVCARRALSEAEAGGFRTVLFHVYSGVGDYGTLNAVTRALGDNAPGALIAGTFSAGEIAGGRLTDQSILVSAMLFRQAEIRKWRFGDIQGNEAARGREIAAELSAVPNVKAAEFLLPGTSFNTRTLLEEVGRCKPGIQIFGGYAGGHELTDNDHFVFDEEGIHHDHILMIAYAGAEFHLDVDKSAGWSILGMPFRVTKADGNRLIEVDGAPAVELYEKYLQIPRDDPHFAEETFEFPLLLMENGEEILRHTMNVDADGTLTMAGYVKEGMEIYLCYGNPSDIVRKVDQRLGEVAAFRPEAILLYSCSVRKSFWEEYVNIEMEPFQQIAETAGFHTWGEIRRDLRTQQMVEYNITLLSIAMREGDPGAEELTPAVRVDDSVLRGQASLIQRLGKLVSATTGELQKAYEDLSAMNAKLTELAEHDALTGIYNRGTIEGMINLSLDSMGAAPVSLVMLDIDHFKHVNDTFGHAVGDTALQAVAQFLKETAIAHEGRVGRWGGEEFFLLLPDTGREQAREVAEALRRRIAEHDFPGQLHHLTASMGVRTCAAGEDRKRIFTEIDDALYLAKKSGRNRVVLCDNV